MVSSEVAPFAKTGGLADVVGALPKALTRKGVSCGVVLPLYKMVRQGNHQVKDTGKDICVNLGGRSISGRIFIGRLTVGIPTYFIRMDHYYDRDGLYGTPEGDYHDNCERFVFFCRAVFEILKALDLRFDIIHCHDWQSALVPVYICTLYKKDSDNLKSVLTIHNLGYQGQFWHWDMPLTGLGWEHFNWKELEFYGKINLLKGGIVYADAITTVSRTYALEIQGEEQGCGLEGVLRERSKDIYGIINGIDYKGWDPRSDRLIPRRYTIKSLAGKGICKAHLQKRCGLEVNAEVPLIGMITRLTEQKGLDIFLDAIDRIMEYQVQFVVLGLGEAYYHDALRKVSERYPTRFSLNIAFDDPLAHQIEAGADMFLMPSRYEPCGLNQLYSLRYGTVPIVRETGGLADTVVDCTEDTLNDGTATGFSFKQYSADALVSAIMRALRAFKEKEKWLTLMKNGMRKDWSWARSATDYIALYEKLLGKPNTLRT